MARSHAPLASPQLEPFQIAVSDEALDDLAARLRVARLPADSDDDWSAGTSPVYLRELVAYWRDRFDWRTEEAKLNRFHQFQT